MRDRLTELKTRLQQRDVENGLDGDEVSLEPSVSLASFFKEVEVIRRTLTDMEAANQRLVEVHRRLHETAHPSKSLREESDDIEGQIRIMAVRVRKQIKGLGACIPQPPSAACARMLAVQEASLGQRLQAALSCLTTEQIRHRDRSQALLQAQLRLVRSSTASEGAEEEELKRLLDLDQHKVSIFTNHLVQNTMEAKRQLADIEARHDELLTLERSIRQVHDLFVDISLHVESQGEMIDRIETHVTKATEGVVSGKKQLHTAEKKKISSRKKKIALLICCTSTVIILVTVFIVVSFYLT